MSVVNHQIYKGNPKEIRTLIHPQNYYVLPMYSWPYVEWYSLTAVWVFCFILQ